MSIPKNRQRNKHLHLTSKKVGKTVAPLFYFVPLSLPLLKLLLNMINLKCPLKYSCGSWQHYFLHNYFR